MFFLVSCCSPRSAGGTNEPSGQVRSPRVRTPARVVQHHSRPAVPAPAPAAPRNPQYRSSLQESDPPREGYNTIPDLPPPPPPPPHPGTRQPVGPDDLAPL